ncbi:hypothetical protein Tco_1257956 [Tanacetum coccineum]
MLPLAPGVYFLVVADRLWEHIPTVGLTVVENKRCGERWIDTHLLDKYLKEVETVGEGVDEFDRLAELTDEMQLKQEDQGCVHASNELQLHVVHVVADEHEVDQHRKGVVEGILWVHPSKRNESLAIEAVSRVRGDSTNVGFEGMIVVLYGFDERNLLDMASAWICGWFAELYLEIVWCGWLAQLIPFFSLVYSSLS